MSDKLYYWAENLNDYSTDNNNQINSNKVIDIKRLNFFIGKNNAGKSRFLRNMFTNKNNISIYTTFPLKINIHEILSIDINNCTRSVKDRDNRSSWSSTDRTGTVNEDINIIKEKFEAINKNRFNYEKYISSITQFMIEVESYKDRNNNTIFGEFAEKLRNAMALNNNYNFQCKYYIPILRGLRYFHLDKKADSTKSPYIWRAMVDYFTEGDDKYRKNISNFIITGESFYENLSKFRNGQEHQWQIFEDYQNVLSNYFFDNERVVIIPIHDDNIPHIKIGNQPQFPISQLGDGLQQAIILTYEAFIRKDETHAFFIEEPELHMHTGMVRQLMNFYLNETTHYYFFTTHSNHLLDMADESDQVMIQKFVKKPKENESNKFEFKINPCDRDRDLLASLGVRPSSVYLANCTIWVEGITDRLYITKYMKKYLEILKAEEKLALDNQPNNLNLYKFRLLDIQRLMPNYHYTFVEYAGSNLTHWDFSDEFTDHLDDCGMNALLTSSSVFLIADGDIKTKNKGMRATSLEEKLGEKFFLLECKETENTLPSNIIYHACRIKFLGLNDAFQNDETKRNALSNHLSMDGMQADTKEGFDIVTLIEEHDYFHAKNGIGKILDDQIRVGNPRTTDDKPKKCFSVQSGTIKEKLKFCRLVLTVMDHVEWELTESAKELCEKIFEHIISENPLPNKKTA